MAADADGVVLLMEDARWLLDRQERNLDTLRGKVATIFAGATVVTAVFANAFQSVAHPSAVARTALGLAIVFFAFTVGCCLFVLWPHDFFFAHDLRPWLGRIDREEGEDAGADPERVALSLAMKYEKHRNMNIEPLRRLYCVFACACALLALQVVLWVVAVG
jgi:hypothetical protein